MPLWAGNPGDHVALESTAALEYAGIIPPDVS